MKTEDVKTKTDVYELIMNTTANNPSTHTYTGAITWGLEEAKSRRLKTQSVRQLIKLKHYCTTQCMHYQTQE